VRATLAPFRYSFLAIGMDAGFVSGDSEAGYYSLYPFAHYAFYWPFAKAGVYAGVGGGYMHGKYSFPEGDYIVNAWTADLCAGVNVLNMLDISYTLRTNFSGANHKVSVGYTYRFKQ